MKHPLVKFLLLSSATFLAGCEVGPDYKPPQVEAPAAYKETGKWEPAKPDDAIDRGAWWSVYKDPVLDGLEKQVEVSNQNLKAAEAAYNQSRAIVDEARAGLFPTVGLDAGATRSGAGSGSGLGSSLSNASGATTGSGKNKTVTTYNLSVSASWELDLWGRIRRTIEGDIASAQASAADLALARLSAQANLATDYFTLRAQDELKHILAVTIEDDRKALKIVQNQYNAGIAAKADVLTAQTQVESVEAQAINVNVSRAQLEHAIAVLIGKPPAALTIKPAMLAHNVPKIPVGVPSALLERRPDIAAAERGMAAANAQIGVAIAAWYPDVTISGSYGYNSVQLGKLISSPMSLWSLGPALAETLFDGGLREAQVEAAHAGYDQTVATYRQAVLTGFQQVEDQLAALHFLGEQATVENQVVSDARKAEELVLNQYKAGTVPYSSVITAETTRLGNEQTELTVRQNRFVASVALIEAIGGGWDVSQLVPHGKATGHAQPVPKPEVVPSAPVSVPDQASSAGNLTVGGVTLFAEPDQQVQKVSNINTR